MNVDLKTVKSFGREWKRYDQSFASAEEEKITFDEYFSIFPWHQISEVSEGFDMGCGSGRWANYVAPKVGKLNCIEPSEAIEVARANLKKHKNVVFYNESTNCCSIRKGSQDFGYCLGVLHHIPEPDKGLQACVDLLKLGRPFLIYIYYAFENRPIWTKYLWQISNLVRLGLCRLPEGFKCFLTDGIAFFVYLPLARTAWLMDRCGISAKNFPLSYYQNRSFYTLRTDARDRFGTPLERRFTKEQIIGMMQKAGLEKIEFSPHPPFWCAVGFRSRYPPKEGST